MNEINQQTLINIEQKQKAKKQKIQRQKNPQDTKMQSSIQNQKRQSSYLSFHPHITKKLPMLPVPASKIKISEQKQRKVREQLYYLQKREADNLERKIKKLSDQNQIFSQSLSYYSPDHALQDLQAELSAIKEEDQRITEQISQCQLIQSNTTPEEYFLFKKNKRLESFNQAMDQLFQQINQQKQSMKNFLNQIRKQTTDIKSQIISMEKQLNKNPKLEQKNKQQPQQSQIGFTIEDNISQSAQKSNVKLTDKAHPSQSQYEDSDSGSSVDYQELQTVKQEYKNELQTYEIISQNKQIMTTQLFNAIQNIQDTLSRYYDTEKTKLFRDITQIKQDLSYVPAEQLIPPNQTQLNYQISPLIQDYQNKLIQVSRKLSSDLKNITAQILTPLRWDLINFQQFLDIPTGRRSTIVSSRQSQKSNKFHQAQKQYQRLLIEIKRQQQQIGKNESVLQEISGETMIYKQKQHEIQLAMNNMRKLLRQQQS